MPVAAPPDPVFEIPQYPALALQHLRLGINSLRRGNNGRRFELYLARSAIFHAIRLICARPNQSVLVPAYICKTAVDPIIAAGASVEFYGVDRRCEIDFDDLQSRIHADTAALVAVHYFGYPTQIERLRDLCDDHGIALIEDCAHVLNGTRNGQPLGTFGDYGLHSWRKFLPLLDGGDLLVNHTARPLDESPARVPRRVVVRSLRHLLSAIPWLAEARRRLLSSGGNNHRESAAVAPAGHPEVDPFETYSDEFSESAAWCAMTWPSRFLLNHVDIERIASARRRNFKHLVATLSDCPGITPFHDTPPPGGAAWIFPAIVAGQPDAHRLLRASGIPATAWDGVRPEQVGHEFTDAEFLYHHLIFLPVHQGLNTADLDRIVDACHRLFSTPASSPV